MIIKRLQIAEVQFIAYRLAKELMEWDEPIPGFESRFPNVLESCITTPFLKYGTDIFYKGLVSKASILFYLMIKNHPFENGNKRIAIGTLLYFLSEHMRWVTVSNEKLYEFSKWVASSDPKLKTQTVQHIEGFIQTNLTELDDRPFKKISDDLAA